MILYQSCCTLAAAEGLYVSKAFIYESSEQYNIFLTSLKQMTEVNLYFKMLKMNNSTSNFIALVTTHHYHRKVITNFNIFIGTCFVSFIFKL